MTDTPGGGSGSKGQPASDLQAGTPGRCSYCVFVDGGPVAVTFSERRARWHRDVFMHRRHAERGWVEVFRGPEALGIIHDTMEE
jgi:hypothetical protein